MFTLGNFCGDVVVIVRLENNGFCLEFLLIRDEIMCVVFVLPVNLECLEWVECGNLKWTYFILECFLLIEFLSKCLDFILCEDRCEGVWSFFMCNIGVDDLGEELNIEWLVKSMGKQPS